MALMRLCCLIALLVVASLLSGCAAVSHPGAAIATHAFATNRASNFSYQISPDGSKLAWLSVHGAALVLNVRHLDSGRLLSNSLTAPATENHVVVALEADGDDGKLTVLAARAGASTRLLGTVAADPDSLIVEQNGRELAHPDLFRLSIATRQLTLLETNDGQVAAWLLRPDGAVGARRVRTGAGAEALQARMADGSYRTVYEWQASDQVSVVSLAGDGASSYLLSNKDVQRVRLIALDHASGAVRVVHAESTVDLAGVDVHPASGAPVLVSSEPDYPRYSVLDASLRRLLAHLPATGPARVSIDSADRSFTRLVVAVTTDRGRAVYLANLADMNHPADPARPRLTLVGPASTATFADALVPMTPVTLRARDGVALHGYLSLPVRRDGASGLPPLVLNVHGGPWSRTVWGYDAMTQFLVNRGYAVLDINFRGSTGDGRAFQALGHGEWGGAMQTDLYDAVAWIGAAGLADTARSAVIGNSYGGYAAAAAVLDQPGMFACGIAINGPLELGDMIDTLPERFRHDRPLLLRYLGAQGASDAVVSERSPGARAASLRRPLLLVQGANDVRVNPLQAARFAGAAQAAGAPLSYWPVAGEGHVFGNWKTKLSLFRRSEQFLAACAGGRDAGLDYYELGYFLF